MQTTLPADMTLVGRPVGEEARKTLAIKLADGFIERYLSGPHILDIGYKGYLSHAVPIMPQALGVDLDYPGYDGRVLPFADGSQDAVFSSHCLEHVTDYRQAIREWYRVLRAGGYMIIVVPHQFLYEKRCGLPSRWNDDHRRFYTPASLMGEIERSLAPNTYRLCHLTDNDQDYDYTIGPDRHARGCYEIELVIQKLLAPGWKLERRLVPKLLLVTVLRWVGKWVPAPMHAALRPLVRRTVRAVGIGDS
jgi:SAM-dependent methyltransferase